MCGRRLLLVISCELQHGGMWVTNEYGRFRRYAIARPTYYHVEVDPLTAKQPMICAAI